MSKLVLIALGGNAILRPGQRGTLEEQVANIRAACRPLAQVVARGYRVVLTHGNGPQVGNLLIQNEAARGQVPPMPMDVCGAMTQGQVGYLLQRELQGELLRAGVTRPVATLVSQVAVDPADPAFHEPEKPVGPFYSEAQARALMDAHGFLMKEDAGRGWRRVVPSPRPLRLVELGVVQDLLRAGTVVIAAGGGGIPVVETPAGLAGVEAVIDKDLAAARLASDLGADLLVILTDVPKVYIHYGSPDQRGLDRITAAEARAYLAQGHFRAGSMRAKVEAALRFLAAGGERAAIAALDAALAAVEGTAGTQVVREGALVEA